MLAFDRKIEIKTQIGNSAETEKNDIEIIAKKKPVVDIWSFVIFICILALSCLMAFLHSYIEEIPAMFLWLTYLSIPIIFGSFLSFYRLWSHNDYHCYEESALNERKRASSEANLPCETRCKNNFVSPKT